MKRASMWKLVGLAGLAGVAATGVAVTRSERQRRAYTPDEVRARLHDRVATLEGGPPDGPIGAAPGRNGRLARLGVGRIPLVGRRLTRG